MISLLKRLPPRLYWVAGFVFGYMVLGGGLAVAFANYEFVYYGLIMLALIGVVAWMDRRVEFSTLAIWGLAVWGLLHMSGGLLPVPLQFVAVDQAPVLYNLRLLPWLPKFDQIVHAFGFGMGTIAAHESLSAHFGRRLPLTIAMIATLFLIGMGLGAVNEVIEFIATRLMPNTNVGGYVNTGWDLVSNATGITLAIAFIGWRRRV